MSFDTRIVDNVHVITPRKNLVGGDETEALKAAVVELAAKGESRVVVDLGQMSWLSSLGICGLIRAKMACDDHQGWLRLACIDEKRISNLLAVTRLNRYFETFDTVEEAVSATVHHV